ncbi:MAG TPA: TMEM43 family protein [Thermoanaerobaculaceae bacterium]|nr:TMEM43 family protein [Thermoanaerobaculaceae bacterium]HRS14750.1 TMEM43 family protein [Thermoanaerobaculaceae bacterium]
MPGDTYTEVTRRSWGSKLGASIKGIFGGLIIALLGVVLLWWNEGRAVTTARSLKEGARKVVSILADRVDPAYEGKLVHTSGEATTAETLVDPDCGVQARALALRRKVEMYQWKESSRSETKKKLGGGEETVTTYSYERAWSDGLIDSSRFKKPEGHTNPQRFPLESEVWRAGTVTLGAFTLSPALASQIGTFEPLPPPDPYRFRLPAGPGRRVQAHGTYLYIGSDPARPEVGDLRISFGMVPPATVSVVAKQSGGTLTAFQTDAGRALQLLAYGVQPADVMFETAQHGNTMLTWLLRLVGFGLIFAGLNALFRPLVVLGDVVPFVGNLLSKGAAAMSFLVAAVVAFVVIALAWIAHRPVLGIALLAAAAGALVLVLRRKKTKAGPPPLPAA